MALNHTNGGPGTSFLCGEQPRSGFASFGLPSVSRGAGVVYAPIRMEVGTSLEKWIILFISLLAAAIGIRWLGNKYRNHLIDNDDYIFEGEIGLLYNHGKFERLLEPGRVRLRSWRFWQRQRYNVRRLSTMDNWIGSGDVDVMSADRLPFRIQVMVSYQITNFQRYALNQWVNTELNNAMTRALTQFAFTTELAEIQGQQAAQDARLLDLIGQPLNEIEILSIAISKITLPPELRRLFVEVEKAKMEGEAALERARGEHAALRKMSNAARLLKDNPELAQLRLLQAVQESKGNSTIVLGQNAMLTNSKTSSHDAVADK